MLEVLPNAEMEKVDREKLPFLFQNSKSFDGRFRTEKKKDLIVCRSSCVWALYLKAHTQVENQWQTSS